MNNKSNILITSAGQRVSLVKAFQTELKNLGLSGKVLTVDLVPGLSPACQISDKSIKVRKVTDDQYITDLISICKKNNIGMIVPTIDTELIVLSENKLLFDAEGINIIISDSGFIKKCRDKRRMNEFFLQHEIDIPGYIDKNNPTFPLFIKPYDGSLSFDTYLINNKKQLLPYHYTNDKLMFMEYIDKSHHDEFTIDMYFGKDFSLKCAVPRKRIHVRAGEINKGVTKKNVLMPFLCEKLNYIEGAIGCLTLQVFLHKTSFRIIALEINPRFGGGFPLSYFAGANYPKWLIQEYFLDQTISYSDNWEENLLMLRYDNEVLVHGSNY